MKIIAKVYKRSKKIYFDREVRVDFFADPDVISIWMDQLRLHIQCQFEGLYIPQHPEYEYAVFNVTFLDDKLISERVMIGDLVDKITPKEIKKRIENYFGYNIKKKSNSRSEVLCRYFVYTICVLKTTLPLQDIGFIYRQDHSTVIYGRNTIKNLVETKDKKVMLHLPEIEKLFGIANLKERILHL